jgi:hypothetical protein
MAKGKYQELFDLGEDALLVMERSLRQGMPKMVLARKLQSAGQMTHLTPRKLSRLLDGYEKDVMDRAMMRRIDEAGLLTAARQAAQLNLNDEMMTAVALQRRRVERAMEQAEKTPAVLFDQHGKEIERYMGMLDRTARVQMDLGIISKAPRRTTMHMIRDANNPNRVSIEMTEEVVSAAEMAADMFGGEISGNLALPAPSDA